MTGGERREHRPLELAVSVLNATPPLANGTVINSSCDGGRRRRRRPAAPRERCGHPIDATITFSDDVLLIDAGLAGSHARLDVTIGDHELWPHDKSPGHGHAGWCVDDRCRSERVARGPPGSSPQGRGARERPCGQPYCCRRDAPGRRPVGGPKRQGQRCPYTSRRCSAARTVTTPAWSSIVYSTR